MNSEKFNKFIEIVKDHFGWNDPIIIDYIDEGDHEFSLTGFDSYIKEHLSDGFDIDAINEINEEYSKFKESVYQHCDECILDAFTGEYGFYEEPIGSCEMPISTKEINISETDADDVWECINHKAKFTFQLQKMDIKNTGLIHVKIKVQDSFGRNMLFENKKCVNNLFQGGKWTKIMLSE